MHTGHAHLGHWPRKDDPVLEHLLRDFRSASLRKQFFTHDVKAYTDTLDVKLLAGTYNVAGKRPPAGLKLHEWLDQWKHCWPKEVGQQLGELTADGPDIVAVGFQEVVPLSAGNVIAGPSSDGADAWDHVLAATLNGDDWASTNAGRTFGSSISSQAAYLHLGSQAAYAAYSAIATQAATVVGAMDKVWSGNGHEENGSADALSGAANAQQQQARLALALQSSEDGDEVYVQVACKQLVGLYLSIWARKRIARHIRGIQATTAATGWGGYLGNKGAVAVRLRVYDAPLVVVCSHLASGDARGDEQRRNADVADIMRRCVFENPEVQQGELGRQQCSSSGHWGHMTGILDHQNVVWLGDLNYRLTCSDEEARKYLRTGRLDNLLLFDELSQEMQAKRVFQGWHEGAITFNPTYKYHLGCNIYSGDPLPPGVSSVKAVDSYASLTDSEATTEGGDSASLAGRDSPSVEKQKKRTPAWCDRILWLPDRQIYQLAYGRGEIAVSDHRPVAAAFLLQAHRYQRETVKELAETARREVDMSSNAARPRFTLEPKFIELGLVPFGFPKAFSVRLENVGATPARFYFVAPPKLHESHDGIMTWDDNQPLCPPWLVISQEEGEVQQGQSTSIGLTAVVSGGGPGSASAFIDSNPPPPPSDPYTLDTILILRLEDGADVFISLRGTYLPSCFGTDLDRLLTLGDGPVVAVEQLGPEGQQLLQQGLQPPALPGDLAQQGQGQDLQEQVAALGLGGGGDPAAAAAAAAAGCSDGGGRSKADLMRRKSMTGVEAHVPKEIQRLVQFLKAPHRLQTPGLFVDSIPACLTGGSSSGSGGAVPGSQPHLKHSGAQLQQLLAATAPVRWALDTGLDLPRHVTPHQAAAALLLLLQQLPDSFLPPDVSGVLVHCVPPAPACMSLLSDTMSVAEWATLRMVLGLCRAALGPQATPSNALTVVGLANVLAEHCFGDSAAGVPPALAANRIAFLMTLLDPAADPQDVEQQQLQGANGNEEEGPLLQHLNSRLKDSAGLSPSPFAHAGSAAATHGDVGTQQQDSLI